MDDVVRDDAHCRARETQSEVVARFGLSEKTRETRERIDARFATQHDLSARPVAEHRIATPAFTGNDAFEQKRTAVRTRAQHPISTHRREPIDDQNLSVHDAGAILMRLERAVHSPAANALRPEAC